MTRCASCGYPEDIHDLGTKRCPRETADRTGRRGTFKKPPPLAPRHPWFGGPPTPIRQPEPAYVPPPPPQVVARVPQGPHEFAGYQGKQAAGLGRRAAGLGWSARALYWRGATGVEGCGVWLSRGTLRAVATWKRAAGKAGTQGGWATDIAYAWRTDHDRPPSKLTHTELERIIS